MSRGWAIGGGSALAGVATVRAIARESSSSWVGQKFYGVSTIAKEDHNLLGEERRRPTSMSLSDISKLPVAEIATEDAMLFLSAPLLFFLMPSE